MPTTTIVILPRLLSFMLSLALLVTSMPSCLSAQDSPRSTLDQCEAETAARLRFIEDRLEDGRTNADYWWKGWLSFYGLGVIVTSVQASQEDDEGTQANDVVSAVKALGGTTRLWFSRPSARSGADEMLAIPAVSQPACRDRLAKGEALLRTNAEEANSRYSWKRHLFNVVVNVTGGLIVAEGFDESDRGWTSAAVGIAVGEVMTFSHPWRGASDLQDYEDRFPPSGIRTEPRVSWHLLPTDSGAKVQVRF